MTRLLIATVCIFFQISLATAQTDTRDFTKIADEYSKVVSELKDPKEPDLQKIRAWDDFSENLNDRSYYFEISNLESVFRRAALLSAAEELYPVRPVDLQKHIVSDLTQSYPRSLLTQYFLDDFKSLWNNFVRSPADSRSFQGFILISYLQHLSSFQDYGSNRDQKSLMTADQEKFVMDLFREAFTRNSSDQPWVATKSETHYGEYFTVFEQSFRLLTNIFRREKSYQDALEILNIGIKNQDPVMRLTAVRLAIDMGNLDLSTTFKDYLLGGTPEEKKVAYAGLARAAWSSQQSKYFDEAIVAQIKVDAASSDAEVAIPAFRILPSLKVKDFSPQDQVSQYLHSSSQKLKGEALDWYRDHDRKDYQARAEALTLINNQSADLNLRLAALELFLFYSQNREKGGYLTAGEREQIERAILDDNLHISLVARKTLASQISATDYAYVAKVLLEAKDPKKEFMGLTMISTKNIDLLTAKRILDLYQKSRGGSFRSAVARKFSGSHSNFEPAVRTYVKDRIHKMGAKAKDPAFKEELDRFGRGLF